MLNPNFLLFNSYKHFNKRGHVLLALVNVTNIMNEFFKKEHITVDANKSTTKDHVLEQTSIKA
jgi:hypothetical protein